MDTYMKLYMHRVYKFYVHVIYLNHKNRHMYIKTHRDTRTYRHNKMNAHIHVCVHQGAHVLTYNRHLQEQKQTFFSTITFALEGGKVAALGMVPIQVHVCMLVCMYVYVSLHACTITCHTAICHSALCIEASRSNNFS